MPATCTIAGADVLDARIAMPAQGRAVIEATIATATAPAGRVTLACDGGLELSCTVVRARPWLDACAVWLVSGAGGLDTPVTGAFRSGLLRDPLREIARACGETLDGDIDSDLLSLSLDRWTLAGSGAASLDALAAEASRQLGETIRWRFTSAGALWMGAESWPAVALADGTHVLDEDPGRRVVLVGGESPTVEPGQDVSGVGRVGFVEHAIRADEVRSRCHLETDALSGFRRAVRGALGLRERAGEKAPADAAEIWRFGRYEARVEAAASDGSTVDIRPLNEHFPPMQGVRLRAPLPGATVVVSSGALVEFGWEAGNPAEPYAEPSWKSGSATKIVIPATSLYLGAEAGAKALGLHGDTVNAGATMATWITKVQAVAVAIDPTIVAPTDFGVLSASATIAKGK